VRTCCVLLACEAELHAMSPPRLGAACNPNGLLQQCHASAVAPSVHRALWLSVAWLLLVCSTAAC
jgi:hypothetical protein